MRRSLIEPSRLGGIAGRSSGRPLAWRLGVIVLLRLSLASLAGCALVDGPTVQAPTSAPSLIVSIGTPDGIAGLARGSGSIDLYLADENGTLHLVTSVTDDPVNVTVHVLSYGGDSGRVVNSFAFGNVPAGAVHADLVAPDVVGSLAAGLFLAGLPTRDINPASIQWRFLDAAGQVIAEGSGLRG